MRISSLTTMAVRVPLKVPAKWSGGTRETAPAVLVRIDTDEGITGWGECVGPTLPAIQALVQAEFAPLLLEQDPLRVEFLVHRMDEHSVNWDAIGRYGISGVEMALLDIKGKAFGVPVAELLGGFYRREVEWMGYLFIEAPHVNARQAAEYVARGFRELKVKVGRSVAEDRDRIAAIRDAVGPDVGIRVDANMAWSVPTAIRAVETLKPFGLQCVEQPVPWHDLDGLREVRLATGVPVAADESCTGIREALALIEKRACDIFTLYVSEAGGLTKAQAITRLADAAGISCILGTWAELGLGTAAAMHLLASSRSFPFANDTHYTMQADDILSPMLEFRGPCTQVPDGPGLGVVPDPRNVERFARLEARDTVFGDASDPRFIPRSGQILA